MNDEFDADVGHRERIFYDRICSVAGKLESQAETFTGCHGHPVNRDQPITLSRDFLRDLASELRNGASG